MPSRASSVGSLEGAAAPTMVARSGAGGCVGLIAAVALCAFGRGDANLGDKSKATNGPFDKATTEPIAAWRSPRRSDHRASALKTRHNKLLLEVECVTRYGKPDQVR